MMIKANGIIKEVEEGESVSLNSNISENGGEEVQCTDMSEVQGGEYERGQKNNLPINRA